jgi:myo-inositol-1(or 4)-monophosphatase
VIDLGGYPKELLKAKQTRTLGSIALVLVDVAAGGFDGHVVYGRYMSPWDYLGGLLICREAGAIVRDVDGIEMVTDDVDARRQIVAAGTEQLARALEEAVRA